MKRSNACGVLFCAALAATAAHAAEGEGATLQDISGPELAGIIRDAGYRAELGTDDAGDPMVTSAAAGATYYVYTYGCEAGRCESIQFRAGFDLEDGVDPDRVNAWNRDMRYGKAWIDDEGDPWVEVDLDLDGGGSRAQVAGYVALWDNVLGQFQARIHAVE